MKNKLIKKKRVLQNNSNSIKKVILKKSFKLLDPYVKIVFNGKVISGNPDVYVKIFNITKDFSNIAPINSSCLIPNPGERGSAKRYFAAIYIPPKTKIEIGELSIKPQSTNDFVDYEEYKNDVLIITPMYPSAANPYAATFVYSKNKEYQQHGISTDVVVVSKYDERSCRYDFRGDVINKVSFAELRSILRKHHYKKIIIHFLDSEIGNAVRACDLDDTEVIIYCHGADVDLYNQNIFGQYFSEDRVFSPEEYEEKQDRLKTLRIYNEMPNVHWVFNTKWNYENAKKATGINFSNYSIIPCFIDDQLFSFQERDAEKRYNILILKKMDNLRQYAVDIAVRTILALSKQPFFNKLNITVAGTGDYQDALVFPLKKFQNVKIINAFFQNDDMDRVFGENGILLAPSRYDTQGVTASEAAMSGMTVVASRGTGLSDILPEKIGTFFDNDNVEEAVEIIKKLVEDEKYFAKKCKECHDSVKKNASESAIAKEIELIKSVTKSNDRLKAEGNKKRQAPILSIVIPTYNAGEHIINAVKSLANQKYLNHTEIIIVNDGSTDNTSEVVKKLIKNSCNTLRDAIKFIDKKNGGHGSTVNAGLAAATGKYFRIMDADDRLDSKSLEQHIEKLLKTDADIVFTNTVQDWMTDSTLRPDHKYPFMTPGVIYDFDELCIDKYGFPGYGAVLSTTSTKTENLRNANCELTEKCFYVDIEYNYYMTEAAKTAMLDPVELYYYALGDSGQSLSDASYKRNFYQHLRVLEEVIKLLEQGKLSDAKYEHFVRVQLHETISHQYHIALDMFNKYSKFRDIEKVLKKYPRYYKNDYLTPRAVKRLRRYKILYFIIRKTYITLRTRAKTVKKIVKF